MVVLWGFLLVLTNSRQAPMLVIGDSKLLTKWIVKHNLNLEHFKTDSPFTIEEKNNEKTIDI